MCLCVFVGISIFELLSFHTLQTTNLYLIDCETKHTFSLYKKDLRKVGLLYFYIDITITATHFTDGFDDLPEASSAILKGQIRGRTIVKIPQ